MTTSLRTFVLLAALFVIAGCPLPVGSAYGKACDVDGDCGEGYRCWTDTCVPSSFGEAPPVDAGDPRKDAGEDDDGGEDGGAPPVDGGHDAGAVDGGDDAGATGDAGIVDAGTDGGLDDAGAPDAGIDAGEIDAGEIDAGEIDAGIDAGDAGAGDDDAGPAGGCAPGDVIDIDLGVTTTYQGDTRLGVDRFMPGCGWAFLEEPVKEQVLRFTPPGPGTLHYELRSDLDLLVSFRDHCDPAIATEVKCIERERPSVLEWGKLYVDDSEPVYLVVDGFAEGDEGSWTLDLEFVEPSCGNDHADPGETCDVPPFEAGWCTQCEMTSTLEGEPNAIPAESDNLTDTVWATIYPVGDVDVYDFYVSEPNTSVTVQLLDTFGGNACDDPEVIDAQIELFRVVAGEGPPEEQVLAMADGGKASGCPVASALIEAADTVYVRVKQAKDFATSPTRSFPYLLSLDAAVAQCGNGRLDVGEQCDDNNFTLGDGCDPFCTFEEVDESEPNHAAPIDTAASPRNRGNDFAAGNAQGPFSSDVVIAAGLSPTGDEDAFSLRHTGASDATITARVLPPTGPHGGCDVASLDVLLHVLDDQGTVIETGDTPTAFACDEVTFTLPPQTLYYLWIHDYGDDTQVPSYFLQIDFE